ncbi:MAG: hypothetical protein L6R40_006640 [Gallowayella cf. fulva]|nr:MAG: hypothetical protein L6R40_006640 [Xanthomendoza cf. fulva]
MSDRSTQQGPDDEVLDPMRSQKSTRSKPSLWDRLVTNWWGFEIAGWLLATLSTAVMIIVFALFDQHAVDSWHSGVTPNALLQVLSQIVQTAMLPAVAESISQLKWLWFHNSNLLGDMPAYADASTGPFATILLVLKRRRVPLVYLAAISSWLVLLYGAFAQQALQQPLREVHDGIGSIPIALIYQASNSTRQRYTGLTDNGDQNTFSITSPPDPVREAITNGLFDNEVTLSAIDGTCRTGNCTWDAYKSLRVYASVEDVTGTLLRNCPDGRRGLERGCIYSVPEIEQHPTWLGSHMQSENQSIWLGASNTVDGYTYPGLNTLVQFYVIYLPDLQVLKFGSRQNYTASLKVFKATLNLGLSTFQTSMLFGATKTTEISRITGLKWRMSQTMIGGAEYDTISTTPPDGSGDFSMCLSSRTYFNQLLSEAVFLGHGDFNRSTLLPDDNAYTTDAARLVGESIYQHDAGRDGLQKLLDNLAISMTNALRTTTIFPSTAHTPARKWEPYFHIAWPWLALPIAAIIATFCLLIATMGLSAHHDIPAWKSSQLASLLAPSREGSTRFHTVNSKLSKR